MSDTSEGGRHEGGGDRALVQQRWKSSPRYPEPDDGSSVVGASARVPSRHRANGSPPFADTSSTAAYPLKVKVTHKELLPSVPSATGVGGARPKLALRRTESSLSGKWAPTGATRLERRISAREAAERIRRSDAVGEKPLRKGAQPRRGSPWMPPGAAPGSSTGIGGTEAIKISSPQGDRVVGSYRGSAEKGDAAAERRRVVPVAVPVFEDSRKLKYLLETSKRAPASVDGEEGKEPMPKGRPTDETATMKVAASVAPVACISSGATGKSDAAERIFAGTRKGKPSKRIVSSVRGRQKDVRRMLAEENDETSAGAKGACATGSSSGTAPERDPAKRDAADARQGLQAMTSVLPGQGKHTNVEDLQDDEMVETRGCADDVPAISSSAIVAVESGAAKRDAPVTLEGSQAMKSLTPMRGRKEVVRGLATEEMAETKDGGPDCVRATGSSSCDVANNDAAAREAVDAAECLLALKSMPPVRGRKAVVRRPLAEETPMMKGDFDGSRPTYRSSSAAPKGDARERDAAYARDVSRGMESISPSRGSKKVAYRPRAKEVIEISDADGALEDSSSSGVAAKSDGPKRYAADVYVPSATGSLSDVAAIRDSVYATRVSPNKQSAPSRRKRNKIDRGPPAEGEAELMSGASGTSTTGSSRSATPKSAAAKRGAADAKERPLAKKSVPSIRGRNRVREPPTEDQVEMRDGAAGAQGTARLSSAAAKSVAPMRASPMSASPYRDAAYSREGSLTYKNVSPEPWRKEVVPDPSIEGNAGMRDDSDSNLATGGSSRTAGKRKYAKNNAAESEFVKRAAVETIEGCPLRRAFRWDEGGRRTEQYPLN